MTEIFKRIMTKKLKEGITWDELAAQANIRQASWMTGLPTSSPTDEELHRMAPVLKTTYEWLKNGNNEEK